MGIDVPYLGREVRWKLSIERKRPLVASGVCRIAVRRFPDKIRCLVCALDCRCSCYNGAVKLPGMRSEMSMESIAALIEREVLSWPNVTAHPYRFGGVEFQVNSELLTLL